MKGLKAGDYIKLIKACEILIRQYNTMPDGKLGRGLTNDPFFKIRDILERRKLKWTNMAER